MPAPRITPAHLTSRAWRRIRQARSTLVLIALTAAACGGAYALAAATGSTLPMLAAGAAMFSVHLNVTASLTDGVNRVLGTLLAVGVATALEAQIGVNAVSVTLLVVTTLVVGRVLKLGKDGALGAAATSIFVLNLGTDLTPTVVQGRVVDTLIGVALGVIASALANPASPEERTKEALQELSEEIGTLLSQLAAGVGRPYTTAEAAGWLRRSRELADKLEAAAAVVADAQTRAKWSPGKQSREVLGLGRTLTALDHSCSQVNNIARTLFDAAHASGTHTLPGELSRMLSRTSEAFNVHAEVVADDEDTAALAGILEAVKEQRAAAVAEAKGLESTGAWLLSGVILAEVDKMVDELGGGAPALDLQAEVQKRRILAGIPTMREPRTGEAQTR